MRKLHFILFRLLAIYGYLNLCLAAKKVAGNLVFSLLVAALVFRLTWWFVDLVLTTVRLAAEILKHNDNTRDPRT